MPIKEAQIYVARKSNQKGERVVGINVQSGKDLIDIELSMEDFAGAVTGLSSPCKVEIRRIGD